jgi:putative membrane protein
MPGISGGSVALILGIYERLIKSIAAFRPKHLALLLNKETFRQNFWRLDLPFLGLIFSGALAGIFICSLFIPYLIDNFPFYTNALFLGLMVASIPHIFQIYDKKPTPSHAFFMILAFFAAICLTKLPTSTNTEHFLFQFVVGMLAIAAMLLPGISGSFILVLFGNYRYIFSELNQAFHFNTNSIINLLPFGFGVLFGAIIFIKLVNYCFTSFRYATIATLLGFMIGGLRSLWPFADEAQQKIFLPSSFGLKEIIIIGLFSAGIFITSVSKKASSR